MKFRVRNSTGRREVMQARFFYIYKFVPNKPGRDGRRAMPDADMNFELNHHDVWRIYT